MEKLRNVYVDKETREIVIIVERRYKLDDYLEREIADCLYAIDDMKEERDR